MLYFIGLSKTIVHSFTSRYRHVCHGRAPSQSTHVRTPELAYVRFSIPMTRHVSLTLSDILFAHFCAGVEIKSLGVD